MQGHAKQCAPTFDVYQRFILVYIVKMAGLPADRGVVKREVAACGDSPYTAMLNAPQPPTRPVCLNISYLQTSNRIWGVLFSDIVFWLCMGSQVSPPPHPLL